MTTTCHVCIAPLNSRRLAFWKELLSTKGLPLVTFSYQDIIQDNFSFDKGTHYVIRLESPGEDEVTYREIISLVDPSKNSDIAHGEVEDFKLWNKGWNILLEKIKLLQKEYSILFLNDPEAISIAFDKMRTQELLRSKDIATPFNLGLCKDYNQLISCMQSHNLNQVFLKPTSGSSASGVMAFRYHNSDKQVLSTTLRKENGTFYNSLKLMRYTKEEEIRETIDKLSSQDLMIEEWIPKWKDQGFFIDFRVLVINGKAQFIVPRGSKHAITNLHLGNVKLPFENLGLSTRQKVEIIDVAEEAMAHLPTLFYAGLDILMDKKGNAYVLEINAFGDLLLGITNDKNQSVYEAEYEAFCESLSSF